MFPTEDKYAVKSDLATYINSKIHSQILITNTVIPAVVRAYDGNLNVVTVQSMFKITLKTGEKIDIPLLRRVPVAHFGGGSFCVSKKPSIGDNGLLLVSQRSLDEWKGSIFSDLTPQQYAPKNKRTHNINDSIFIPLHFPKNRENGLDYSGSIEFKNDFTTLFSVLNGILNAITTIVTSLITFISATTALANAVPLAGQAFTAVMAPVTTRLTELQTQLVLERVKLRSLLKS